MSDPSKPTSNDEKFKPQNVADGKRIDPSQRRDADRPADTGGHDTARGSEPETRNSSNQRG